MSDYEDDFEDDYEEEALDDCAWDGTWGHSCGAIGSEECDWDCPFSTEMWRGLQTPRDSKGRFCKRVKS